MKIFLDTEFTSLKKPRLISLGLVADDGREFYRELTTGWKLAECTMFVLGWVLPLLSGGKTGLKLKNKLGKHLDLIQWECDADNQFPADKETSLTEALKTDSELSSHLDFLAKNYGSSDLQVWRNKHVWSRINGYRIDNLICGEWAKSKDQVKQDLLDWLECFPGFTLCCDSHYDHELIKDLLGQPLKWQLIDNRALPSNVRQLHHALDDARAMRSAYV